MSATVYRLMTTSFVLAAMAIGQMACTWDGVVCPGDPSDVYRPLFWEEASHCPGVSPDYDIVFDDTSVLRIDLSISNKNHERTLDDMDDKYSGGGLAGDLDGQTGYWIVGLDTDDEVAPQSDLVELLWVG